MLYWCTKFEGNQSMRRSWLKVILNWCEEEKYEENWDMYHNVDAQALFPLNDFNPAFKQVWSLLDPGIYFPLCTCPK